MNKVPGFASNAVIVVIAAAQAACSTVGEKNFGCPGRPAGVTCMSASQVYEASAAMDFTFSAGTRPAVDSDVPGVNARRTKSERRVGDRRATSTQTSKSTAVPTLPSADRPTALRTPAQVMRVWVAPWEDTRGVLHGGGYQFIELETRRWVLGEHNSNLEPVRFFSLQSVEAAGSVGNGQDVKSRPRSERSSEPLPDPGASKWTSRKARPSRED